MPEGRLSNIKSFLKKTDAGDKKRVYTGKVVPLTPNYPVMTFTMDHIDASAVGKPKDKALVEFRKLPNRRMASIRKVY